MSSDRLDGRASADHHCRRRVARRYLGRDFDGRIAIVQRRRTESTGFRQQARLVVPQCHASIFYTEAEKAAVAASVSASMMGGGMADGGRTRATAPPRVPPPSRRSSRTASDRVPRGQCGVAPSAVANGLRRFRRNRRTRRPVELRLETGSSDSAWPASTPPSATRRAPSPAKIQTHSGSRR